MLATQGEGSAHTPTLDGQLRCQHLALSHCTDLNQAEGQRESVRSVGGKARAGQGPRRAGPPQHRSSEGLGRGAARKTPNTGLLT